MEDLDSLKEEVKNWADENADDTNNLMHRYFEATQLRHWCEIANEAQNVYELMFGEDVDLLLRVRELKIPFTILRKNMLYYRVHPNSMMSNPDPRISSDFRLATFKSLKRRRSSGKINEPLPHFSSFLEPTHEPS